MNKRGQETRKHIKKCACSVFAEKGFKQVTMKDICEAAQLSRGGLYCHYESTRQIFQEIIEDMTGQQDNEIDLKIKQNQSAVTILDDILYKYENEMIDSRSSLSAAIYEYFSIHDIAGRNVGKVWTTDAIYRETPEVIEERKNRAVLRLRWNVQHL